MFLHNDEELFKDVIIAASVDQKRPVAIVEKDYYVTMILKLWRRLSLDVFLKVELHYLSVIM